MVNADPRLIVDQAGFAKGRPDGKAGEDGLYKAAKTDGKKEHFCQQRELLMQVVAPRQIKAEKGAEEKGHSVAQGES